jgi:hypothetical protein
MERDPFSVIRLPMNTMWTADKDLGSNLGHQDSAMCTSFQIVPLDYLSGDIQSQVQCLQPKVRIMQEQTLKNQISWKVCRDHPKKDHSQGDYYQTGELKFLATFRMHLTQECFHLSHIFHLHHSDFRLSIQRLQRMQFLVPFQPVPKRHHRYRKPVQLLNEGLQCPCWDLLRLWKMGVLHCSYFLLRLTEQHIRLKPHIQLPLPVVHRSPYPVDFQ